MYPIIQNISFVSKGEAKTGNIDDLTHKFCSIFNIHALSVEIHNKVSDVQLNGINIMYDLILCALN